MPSEPGWWDSLLRIKVHVQLVVASIEVTFEHAPSAPSPYRLDNRTGLQMACVQKGVEHSVAHRVPPKSEAPFAWGESSMEHSLLVSLYWMQTQLKDSGEAEPMREVELQPLVVEQPVALDAMLKPVPLGSPPVAWASVRLVGGMRVLTVTEQSEGPPLDMDSALFEEPHTFIGLQVAGFGLSLVHVAAGEELLYLSLDRLTADYVQSKQSATTELRLQSFQVDCQQASSTMPAFISRADAAAPGGKGPDGQDLPPLVRPSRWNRCPLPPAAHHGCPRLHLPHRHQPH